jgi:hypothetical protein
MRKGEIKMKRHHLAYVLLMTLVMTSILAFAQPTKATESTFVAVIGSVNSYGGQPAYGWLGAFAEISVQAEVAVFWAPGEPPELELPATYSFFTAQLVSSETVELDYMGSDFYVSGLWDVYNVTFIYDEVGKTIEQNIELLIDDGPGELSVTNGWTMFTVGITGIEQIAGIVLYYCIKTVEIPRDIIWDGTVNIRDLVRVAKAYGTTPGIGNYYFDVDLNYDFVVDIYDLTTLAANLGESY